jgi:hypothetical protein
MAEPQIKNLNFSTNSKGDKILTLSGSNFLSGPNIVLYSSFADGIDNEVIPLDNPTIGQWANNGTAARFIAYHGNDMGFKLYNDGQTGFPILNAVFPYYTADVFVSYSVTTPENSFFPYADKAGVFPDASSWKLTWLMDDGGYRDRDGKADLCAPQFSGYGSVGFSGNDGSLSYVDNGKVWWDFYNTNHLSFYTKVSTINPQTENGTLFFQSASQGKGMYNFLLTDKPAALSTANTSYQYNMINFPGWYRKGTKDNFQAIYDNIYIAVGSSHVARLELTDSPTYASSTKVYTIPYETWNNNKIRLNFTTIALPNIDKLYLHVTDKFAQRSNQGYAISTVRNHTLDFIIHKILNSHH